MQRIQIPAKASTETFKQAFDFTSQLGQLSTTTISSATCTITVYSGTDPSPLLTAGSPAISGLIVTVALAGGVAGVLYLVTVTATASTGDIRSIQGFVAIVNALA
jgi:hypothetical protein